MEYFSTSTTDPDRRLNAWKDILAEVYFKLEVELASNGLQGEIRQSNLGLLTISSFQSNYQRNVRTRGAIAQDTDDSYVFLMPVQGELECRQSARQSSIKPGGYVLLSSSDFYEIECSDQYANLTVKIPGPELRSRLPNAEDHCALSLAPSPQLVALARNQINGLLELSLEESRTRQSLASNLIDLISVIISAANQITQAGTQHGLRRRLQAYILANLPDPALSPSKIADANSISRSTLHKLFQASDRSVNKYIIESRLQRAYEILSTMHGVQLTVAEIAYQCGFKSVPHFSRLFVEQYGIPPGRLRSART